MLNSPGSAATTTKSFPADENEPFNGASGVTRDVRRPRPSTIDPIPANGWPLTVWSRYGPPVLAYLAGQLLFAVAAHRYGFDWLDPDSRIRWDGGIYLDIARTGYYADSCAKINPEITGPGAICGNAGWFPLFPYLVLGLTKVTGLGLETAGVLVTEICILGVLIMVWQLLGATSMPRRIACLAVAATLPAGVYFHATFPMSLTVLLTLLTFSLLMHGRWLPAGLTGAAAAMSYPLGVLLAPAAVVLLLVRPGRWSWRKLGRAAYVGGLTGAGLLAFFVLLQLTTGRFDAYLSIQRNYTSDRLNNPVVTLVVWLGRSTPAVAAEMVFSVVLLALAVFALVRTAAAGRATALDWTLATVYGPVVLLFTLVYGVNHSHYRSHTLLLPLVLLLRHLPAPVVVGLAVLAAPLTFVMTGLYLTRALV